MNFHLTFIVLTLILILAYVHKDSAIDTMPELKKNVLNFGYGANFKYKGMLSHSFDRFCVVAKFEITKVKDLKLSTFSFHLTCNYLNISKAYMQRYIKHCKRITPYAKFYKKQIEYCNCTAYEILQNKIGLILPTFGKRRKRFLATVLGSIASSVIGLPS